MLSKSAVVDADLALVRVQAEGKEYDFEAVIGSNLLGSALKSKVPIDNICRVGLCGACQVCVLEGASNLSKPSEAEWLLLDRAPLEEDVRLACQARVEGDVFIRHTKLKTR